MDICSQGKPHIITWVIKKEFYPAHRKRECKKSVLGHQCNWSLAIKDGHLFPSSWNTAEIWLRKKKTGKKVCICVFNALFLPMATKKNFAMIYSIFSIFHFFFSTTKHCCQLAPSHEGLPWRELESCTLSWLAPGHVYMVE